MRKAAFFMLAIIFIATNLLAQTKEEVREGKISYISSQNVYASFNSTKNIKIGDYLFINQNNELVPVIQIKQLSSISCIGTFIGDKRLNISDVVYAKVINIEPVAKEEKKSVTSTTEDAVTRIKKEEKLSSGNSEQSSINGRLSVSSYLNFSNTSLPDKQRLKYTFSMDAANLANSKFSAETYITYFQYFNSGVLIKDSLANVLKVYSLAAKYQPNKTTEVWIGRKINSSLSNVGAVDGLQFETKLRNFSVGAVAGYRPDYTNYGLDFNSFEYGAFVAHSFLKGNGRIQNSLAFFEQRNNSQIDRRFTYFQHSNTLIKNLNVFLSFEMDLYKRENGIAKSTLNPISLYLSANYRVMKNLSLSASYDARKNVVYYEMYKTIADSILDSSTRQGFRLNANYRPVNFLSMGVNASYRDRKEDLKATKNVGAHVTYSQIPWIKTSATISANYLQTSYVDGSYLNARLSRDFLKGKLYTELSYKFVNYQYLNSNSAMLQHIAGANVCFRIQKTLIISADYEGTFESSDYYNRIYVNVIKRF